MKKLPLLVAALVFMSCSTFTVDTEIKESSLKNYKKSALLFRTGKLSPITRTEFNEGLRSWIDGYNRINDIVIIENGSDRISSYDSETKRFYQVSEENIFFTQKSRGSVAAFYRDNIDEIKSIFSSGGFDSLIICEIESYYSRAIQKIGFNSVMVIIDDQGNISYLDHQEDSYKIDDFFPDPEKSKRNLADKISMRIIENLISFGYLEDK